MLHSDEPKRLQINVRVNEAEKAMLERLQRDIRPRVSISRLLVYICEEEARRRGFIQDKGDGTWTIAEAVSRKNPDQ